MQTYRLLLVMVLASLPIATARAQEPHRSFDGGVRSMFTHWNVDHLKEDGTGDDICMMTASWRGRPVNFSLRKDAVKSYYTVRILDPKVSFVYGVLQPVAVVFDGDLTTHSWGGPGSGVGSEFDFRVPGGPSFVTFEGQMLSTDMVSVVVGAHVWTQAIGETDKAYAMLKDCSESVAVGDRRW